VTCDEFEDTVDAIVAGDIPDSAAARAHRAACPSCSRAFAAAQALDRALAARPAAVAPPRFTAAVLARIRTEHWRADQRVDRVFNIAVVVGVLGIVAGGLALLNLGSVTAAIVSFASLTADVFSRPGEVEAAALPTWVYALGGALLATSLFIWRWAEGEREQPERVRP
jgi:anti-sigma factor RsiW